MRRTFARFPVIVVVVAGHGQVADAKPPPGLAPALYERGNLRIAVACAESYFVTMQDGLRVYIDGAPLDELALNGESYVTSDADGNVETDWAPTDIAFLVGPGHHQLRIEAPECVTDERDVDIAAEYATRIGGRLAVRDPDLMSPTAAPNGYSLVLGGYLADGAGIPSAGSSGSGSFSSTYTNDRPSSQGFLFSNGIERRHFAFWVDEMIGWGSISGTVSWQQPLPFGVASAGPFRYTGTVIDNSMTIRIGARLPIRNIALAAGTGIGASLLDFASTPVDSSSSMFQPPLPSGVDFEWYVPAWSSVTIKPSCGWGVQAVASYNVEPSSGFAGALRFLAGVEIQSAAACSEPPHIEVKP